LAGAQAKAKTKQIEDKTARELLENALDDVANLATISVNAMADHSGGHPGRGQERREKQGGIACPRENSLP
ncbi:MAG: hypothetical protein K2K53_09525, partial [Oscillospiraceae bacterium]|nr:hypothetical protein [Oscillospiraceae bacterium]